MCFSGIFYCLHARTRDLWPPSPKSPPEPADSAATTGGSSRLQLGSMVGILWYLAHPLSASLGAKSGSSDWAHVGPWNCSKIAHFSGKFCSSAGLKRRPEMSFHSFLWLCAWSFYVARAVRQVKSDVQCRFLFHMAALGQSRDDNGPCTRGVEDWRRSAKGWALHGRRTSIIIFWSGAPKHRRRADIFTQTVWSTP